MRRYNIMRPILILVVAYAVNNLAILISTGFGASKEAAEGIGFVCMLTAAILMFLKLNRLGRRK